MSNNTLIIGIVASGRISIISKYSETIERIIKDLPSINFLNYWRYDSKPDKRTKKSYTNYQKNPTYIMIYYMNIKDGIKMALR